MESKWRYNVWALGQWGVGWKKIARVNGKPFPFLPDGKVYYIAHGAGTFGFVDVLIEPGLPGVQMRQVFAAYPPAAHPHFPFGFDVEPDRSA